MLLNVITPKIILNIMKTIPTILSNKPVSPIPRALFLYFHIGLNASLSSFGFDANVIIPRINPITLKIIGNIKNPITANKILIIPRAVKRGLGVLSADAYVFCT